MAKLPDVAAESQQPVPQPSGGVAAYEPPNWRQVGAAGQILAGAGRQLEDASSIVAATNERQDDMVAQAAGNKLAQVRIQQEFDPQTGFRNAKEGQAVGAPFVDGYTQKWDDAVQKIRDGLQNDNQRQIFDRHAGVQALQFKSALLQHQAVETDRFNDATDDASLKTALQQMAVRPTDELNFQIGLAKIDGTLDAMAKRKGLPPEQVEHLKATYRDAAYSTRITSIMDGIPGVAPANPYLAEKMFRQVQDQLGPASQTHLAVQVQKAVQSVQARDIASSIIFGGQAPAVPSVLAPAVTGSPLEGVVRDLESGGNPNAVSPKGAMGAMQVMPATAANPGYGIKPAQKDASGNYMPGELDRVGRDVLGAMSARYQDPALVMAAYNAGPGRVDEWLQKNGDPRTGQVSMQDWISKIPFAETRNYVAKGLQKLNAAGGHPDATITAPTAKQLKVDLYSRAFAARGLADQLYPGDTAFADALETRVLNYGRMVIANQSAQEQAAADGLRQGMLGSKPDGSDAPQTIDQLLSDPQQKRNWNAATPEVRQMVQREYATGVVVHSDPKLVNDLMRRVYLPDGDPQKITQPWQLNDYMGNGLNYTDHQRLMKLMTEAMNPEGSPFAKQVGQVKETARKMLVQSYDVQTLTAKPEVAQEAAYRFAVDLDKKVADYRKQGKDPQTLFDPSSKDYVLSPGRVQAFMPSPQEVAAREAAAVKARSGEVPKVNSAEEYNLLAPGTTYIDPSGIRRTKGGTNG